MANKDLEVDHEISRAEMPTITGSEEFDPDVELMASQSESPLFIEAKKRKVEVLDVDAASAVPQPAPVHANITSTNKKYVSAASFYAPAQPKKTKGPLLVPGPLHLLILC